MVVGVGAGAFAATVSPWAHADKVQAFRLMAYVQPYLGVVLPNLLLTAAIFFALVSLTRQMLPNYVGGAVLLIGYLLAGSLFNDIANKELAALIDPFGLHAQTLITQYWSIAEKNSRLVPIHGILLENRLLWLGVAAVIFTIAFLRFKFAYSLGDGSAPAEAPDEIVDAVAAAPVPVAEPAHAESLTVPVRMTALPAMTQRFDARARWVQFRSIFERSFGRIIRSRYFGVIVGAGLLYLVVVARAAGKLFGTTTWPVTVADGNAAQRLVRAVSDRHHRVLLGRIGLGRARRGTWPALRRHAGDERGRRSSPSLRDGGDVVRAALA